jgi:hypothetical protein
MDACALTRMPRISIPGEVWLRNHSSPVIWLRKKFATILPQIWPTSIWKNLAKFLCEKVLSPFWVENLANFYFRTSPKFHPNSTQIKNLANFQQVADNVVFWKGNEHGKLNDWLRQRNLMISVLFAIRWFLLISDAIRLSDLISPSQFCVMFFSCLSYDECAFNIC